MNEWMNEWMNEHLFRTMSTETECKQAKLTTIPQVSIYLFIIYIFYYFNLWNVYYLYCSFNEVICAVNAMDMRYIKFKYYYWCWRYILNDNHFNVRLREQNDTECGTSYHQWGNESIISAGAETLNFSTTPFLLCRMMTLEDAASAATAASAVRLLLLLLCCAVLRLLLLLLLFLHFY